MWNQNKENLHPIKAIGKSAQRNCVDHITKNKTMPQRQKSPNKLNEKICVEFHYTYMFFVAIKKSEA